MFGSLDYSYVPVADVDGEALRYVQMLGAELVKKVTGKENVLFSIAQTSLVSQ